jgi:hypothetical protein
VSDNLPPMEQILPAVEHVMGTLDADAGLIQTIADKLVQAPGASIDGDKAVLKRIKSALSHRASQDVIKYTGGILDGIGGRLRASAAQSVDADQTIVDGLMARLPPLPRVPAQSSPPQPAPSNTPAPVCIPPPGAAPPMTGCMGAQATNPPFDLTPLPPPSGYYRVVDARGLCWDCPVTGIAPPPSPPPIVPPPVPPPIPPGPPTTPPPPTVPPSPPPLPVPVQAGVCGPLPDGLPAARVYIVPWLDPDAHGVASAFSECGSKEIDDALAVLFPVAPIVDAIIRRRQSWVGVYLGYTSPVLPDDLLAEPSIHITGIQ